MTDIMDSDDLNCIICMDLLFYPVLIVCGHKFCKQCFFDHTVSNGFFCPICRHRLSNWLRQVKKKNIDIVDTQLWKKIQKKFPHKVLKRKKEVAGLIDPAFTETTTVDETAAPLPKPKTSLPGEIKKEYEEMRKREMEETQKEKEKEMKLSEALIKLIEEEERKEREEREKQLKIDEALARTLREEDEKSVASESHSPLPPASTSSSSLPSGYTDCNNDDTPSAPDWALRMLGDSPVCLGPVSKQPWSQNVTVSSASSEDDDRIIHCSTPLPVPADSPLPRQAAVNLPAVQLDKPCTSGDSRFGRFSPVPTEVSPSQEDVMPSDDVPACTSQGPVPTTVSLPTEASSSHFARVQRNPTDSFRGELVLEPESESRCSSGNDSIGQELHHFKPIRSSPTTRNKDGSSAMIPHKVVAQKAVPTLSLFGHNPTAASPTQMEEDDELVLQQSILEQEIEEMKKRRQEQIEEDARFARELLKADEEELRKINSLNKTKRNYNLRKRSQKRTLRKKVLIDRAQTTLDKMLVKN